jgi:hypothetical protein
MAGKRKKSARDLVAGDEMLSMSGKSLGVVKKISSTADRSGSHRTTITLTNGRVLHVNGGQSTTDEIWIR